MNKNRWVINQTTRKEEMISHKIKDNQVRMIDNGRNLNIDKVEIMRKVMNKDNGRNLNIDKIKIMRKVVMVNKGNGRNLNIDKEEMMTYKIKVRGIMRVINHGKNQNTGKEEIMIRIINLKIGNGRNLSSREEMKNPTREKEIIRITMKVMLKNHGKMNEERMNPKRLQEIEEIHGNENKMTKEMKGE